MTTSSSRDQGTSAIRSRRRDPTCRPSGVDESIGTVPTISRFYGILIRMYLGDHPPAHFHVRYGEHKARFEIATGDRIDGGLPPRAERLVGEWADLHRTELEANWRRCEQRGPLAPVDPLR